MARLTITIEDNTYPAVWEICDECRGNGTYANRAFDGLPASGGMEENPFDDEDFVSDYLSGAYDVRCEICGGSGKILVPDYERMTEQQITDVNNYHLDMAEMEAENRAERMIGY